MAEKDQSTEAMEQNQDTPEVESSQKVPSEDMSDAEVDERSEEEIKIEKLEAALEESKEKHLRLYSEFDNYKRRSARERLELIQNASKDLIEQLLPILDDFERAIKASEKENPDNKSVVEGLELIYNKCKKILGQQGLKEMECGEGTSFDPDLHEAITQIPAPTKKLKGKIVDVVEKGYFLNDRVIRFAKVVVGQ